MFRLMSTPSKLASERYKIESLLALVRRGDIRLPRFQRQLRWTESDIAKLFDSIYRGYPIGTLLLWDRPADAGPVSLGPVHVEAMATNSALWVVDGQQRITSLAACLLPTQEPAAATQYDISFDLEKETFQRSSTRDPLTHIPVREAYDLSRILVLVRDRGITDHLQDRAFRLADQLRNYEIPAYRVSSDDEQALREIFDRTNTSGKSMTKKEVFRALNTGADGARDNDYADLEAQIESMGFGLPPGGNTLLYCTLATRGKDILRDFRSEFKSDDDRAGAFRDTVRSMRRTQSFLKNEADVPHFSVVPYQHQVVGLVRFFALYPDPSERTLTRLRRWFWRATESGPLPRKGNTGTLKATAGAISADGEESSVHRLLSLTKESPGPLKIGVYRWTEASTRSMVCALSALHPIDPLNERLIDTTALIEQFGREALTPIVEPRTDPSGNTIANRTFLVTQDDGDVATSESVLDLFRYASPATQQSHLLTLSNSGDELVLDLPARLARMQEWLNDFLASRTERNLTDHGSLEEMFSGE